MKSLARTSVLAALAALILACQTPDSASAVLSNQTDGPGPVTPTDPAKPPVPPIPQGPRNLMGINLNLGVTDDWGEERLFADAMKTARMWWAGNSFDRKLDPSEMDAQLWPKVDACLVVFDLARAEGTYRCSFTGQAQVTLGPYGGPGSVQAVEYHADTNKTNFQIVITNPEGALTLAFQNTKGGIRDLKIMRPLTRFSTESYPEGTRFTDQALALIKKFRVIRFMDFFHTNGSQLVHWDDRPQLDAASFNSEYRPLVDTVWEGQPQYTGRGGCYEDAIDLCNASGCDFWLNVPLKADNDYVDKLAQLVKDRLNPSLNVYVEYSNEVWNTAPGFSQGEQNLELARADVAAGDLTLLAPEETSGSYNDWEASWRRVGRRIAEISDRFRAVWGDEALPAPGKASPRVRPVLMGQQGNLGSFESLALLHIDHHFPQPVAHYLYGAGGSGYYNDEGTNTLDTLWSSATMDPAQWVDVCRKETAVAHAYGLRRICYEGGPSFDSNSPEDEIRKQAWGDPRMQTNLEAHVDQAWSAADGDLFVFYAAAGGYQWGFTQDIFHLDTPKLKAIDALNSRPKAPATVGRVPPFTVNGDEDDFTLTYRGSGYPLGTDRVTPDEASTLYAFRTMGTSTQVKLTLVLGPDPSQGDFQLWNDGILKRTVAQGALGEQPVLVLSDLGPGLHVVMIKTLGKGLRVSSLRFE